MIQLSFTKTFPLNAIIKNQTGYGRTIFLVLNPASHFDKNISLIVKTNLTRVRTSFNRFKQFAQQQMTAFEAVKTITKHTQTAANIYFRLTAVY